MHVSVHITEKGTSYPEVRPLEFQIAENLPVNVEPQKHLRHRISEELRRNFTALHEPLANMTDDAEQDDPLDGQ